MMSIIYIVYIQRQQRLGYVSQYEVKHNVLIVTSQMLEA